MLGNSEDAYGHLIYDYFRKGLGQEIVERDDGLISVSKMLPAYYFAQFRHWKDRDRRAMRFIRGRALDLGCGAGRVALYLQQSGFDILGIDVSPLALRVCKRRGLKKVRLLSAARINQLDGKFDTLLMLGNNFGLFSSFRRGRAMLKSFYGKTTQDARIIAETLDPYKTKDEAHLAYQRRNRRRGRMSGQVRIRVRYRTYKTQWFDYLLVSKYEMRRMVRGTGWYVQRFLNSPGAQYIAIIGKSAN